MGVLNSGWASAKAKTSGLGLSPRVALSKVAASTPPASAVPRRPERQAVKFSALAGVAAQRGRQRARQEAARRKALSVILIKALPQLRHAGHSIGALRRQEGAGPR